MSHEKARIQDETKALLRQRIADLDEEGVLELVRARQAAGAEPIAVIAVCEEGMRLVGERYERGEYRLSGLIMAGEIFREVLELARPMMETAPAGEPSGRVLLGTVKGDIHDIGKAILQMALRAHGFEVQDLGVDVPPQVLVDRAVEWRPDVVGLSCLLTSSYDSMRETTRLLKQHPDLAAHPIPVIIGGGVVNDMVREYVGADHWCNDALGGVRLCQQLVENAKARRG